MIYNQKFVSQDLRKLGNSVSLLFKQYGSGIRSNLNKQQFHNMPFLFPPLDEQARISAVIKHKVEAIDTIISETQNPSMS